VSDFDKDLIISLSELLNQTGLSEIEIENKRVGRIKVAKNIIQVSNPLSGNSISQDSNPAGISAESHGEDLQGAVLSPMVGTIYLRPDPESDPFVVKGDKVKKGQTLLIVEAMKTMNNISAEKDGIIKKILVQDEQPIQFGDPLIIIE